MGVREVAAQPDREVLVRAQIPEPVGSGGLGHPEVRPAVGHLRHLADDPLWLGERVVDHPQRAAAADPAEVKRRRGLSL